MRRRHRRSFRSPVVSTLTLAWAGFVGAAGLVATGTVIAGATSRDPSAVALKIEGDVERLARAVPDAAAERQSPRAPAIPAANILGGDALPVVIRPGDRQKSERPERTPDDVFASLATRVSPGPPEPIGTLDPETLEFAPAGSHDVAQPAAPAVVAPIVITVDGAPAKTPRKGATESLEAAALRAPGAPISPIDAALLRRTAHGTAPAVAADGRRAQDVYAKPFVPPERATPVSLIVGGLGLNDALTARAIDDLPANVTLAFAPYARRLDYWTARAREAGHEVMIELPMEARRGSVEALGPAALTAGARPEDTLERLEWLLSRTTGYFAVTNYLGGKFAADDAAMQTLIARLRASGVAYFDDTGAAARLIRNDPAAAAHVASVEVLIEGTGETASDDLKSLLRAARRRNGAVGKAYAYDDVIDAAAEWAAGLEGEGLVLAPASALLGRRAKSS